MSSATENRYPDSLTIMMPKVFNLGLMETRNSLTLVCNMLPIVDLRWKERNLLLLSICSRKPPLFGSNGRRNGRS